MASLPARRALAPAAVPGALVIEVPGAVAVCFDAPVVELFEQRAESLHPSLGMLGPDLLAPEFDAEAGRRAGSATRRAPSTAIAEALLDQRALAGIGNVYKNEVLLIERVSPFATIGTLDDETARPSRGQRAPAAPRERGGGPRPRAASRPAATAARLARCTSTTAPAGRAIAAGPRSPAAAGSRPAANDLLVPQLPARRPRSAAVAAGRVSSRPMCEHFIARAAEPFRLDDLWPFAERLERFGLGGFGWGATWLARDGGLGSYRDVRAFRDDPGREAVGATETTAALVHLRRPSRLSTLSLEDTQPFDDPAARYAFSHNGDFVDYRRLRTAFRAQGRIHGRADTEVGARWLEDAWHEGEPVPHLLAALHDTFGGQANLAVLTARRDPASLRRQPARTRCSRSAWDASASCRPGMYSLDRSLFRFAAPGATERRLVAAPARPPALDRNGTSHPGVVGCEAARPRRARGGRR